MPIEIKVFFGVIIVGGVFGAYLAIKGALCLHNRNYKTGLSYLLVGLPILLLLIVFMILPIIATARSSGPTPCMRNMRKISKAIYMYSTEHNETFPTSFNQITNFLPDQKTFICPHSGQKAGPLALVDQWTDYVLVTNVSPTSHSDLIQAYCKPENHNGIGCNLLYVDGSTTWANEPDFSNLTCNVKAHSRTNERKPQQSSGGDAETAPPQK